jgi:hypothetical protein
MCREAAMAEPCEGVGEAAMAETHKAQEGASSGVRCSQCLKPLWVCYKLDEAIEKSCSDLLATQHRMCIHGRMEIS